MTDRNALLSAIGRLLSESADSEIAREDWTIPGLKGALTFLAGLVPVSEQSPWPHRFLADDADRYVEEWVGPNALVLSGDAPNATTSSKAAELASLRRSLLATLERMVSDPENFGWIAEVSDARKWRPVRGAVPLRVAARLLGSRVRDRYVEEWMAHLAELPKPERSAAIISLLLSIPKMAIALRWGSLRRRRRRD